MCVCPETLCVGREILHVDLVNHCGGQANLWIFLHQTIEVTNAHVFVLKYGIVGYLICYRYQR